MSDTCLSPSLSVVFIELAVLKFTEISYALLVHDYFVYIFVVITWEFTMQADV